MDASPISLGYFPIALAAATLLRPVGREQWGAFIGVLGNALAIVSLGIAMGAEPFGPAPQWTQLAHLPKSFLAVNGGLLLLGLGMTAWPVFRHWTSDSGATRFIGGIQVAVVALVMLFLWPALNAGKPLLVLAAAAGLAGAGLGFVLILDVSRFPDAVRRLDRSLLERIQHRGPVQVPTTRFDLALVLGSVLAALIVAIGSTLGAVCAAAFGTSILAQVYGRRRRWVGPFPVLPVTALGLVPVYWLLVTASGPGGSSFRALTEAPISPAAEIVLTPPLLLASWGFLGLWPLSGLVPGAALAPIGGALLWRIGIELIPGGMAHWQPLIMPLAVAGVWQGAVLKRPATVLVGLGTLGLASLQSAGAVGGVCNLCIAAAVDVRNRFLGSRTPPAYVLTRLGWVVPAWAGLLVIDAALRAQVLYTVVACAGVAVALRPEAAARLS